MEIQYQNNILGEEPPHIAKLCIAKKYNIQLENISFYVTELPNIFRIKVGDLNYKYILSKPGSNNTRGDIYFNGEDKDLMEFTACCLSSSGNNAQFQRFTKFIPFLTKENMKLSYYIYNICEKTSILNRQNKVAFRMWKTIGIKVFFEKENLQNQINMMKEYTDLNTFIEDWNLNAQVPQIEMNEEYCVLDKFNLIKSDSVTNDPGIGKTLLTIMTIVKLGHKKIKLNNTNLEKEKHFTLKNKFFRSIRHIIDEFNVEIKFDFEYINLNIMDCKKYDCEVVFGQVADYESVASINYEIKLGDKVNYTNHASCEQSLLKFKNINYNVPKKILKTDIIYTENNTTYLVEAEKYVNLENGIEQINTWISNINTKKYYEDIFQEQKIKCYIILFDKDNCFVDFEDFKLKNVRYILQNNGKWLQNPNFQYLEMN